MDPFESYMQPILKEEGTYSNNPLDRGGPTRWGITQARARAAGYMGDMQDLPLDGAMAIYRKFYWLQPGFDLVAAILPSLAVTMLDLGINMGQSWPGTFVQRALNVLNRDQNDFPDIVVDGAFGAMSRASLRHFLDKRGAEGAAVLVNMVHAQASVRYIEIAERSPTMETFEYGWQQNRAFGPIVSRPRVA